MWAVTLLSVGDTEMLRNVLDAIRDGDWHFEPESVESARYSATSAIPGSSEKLAILAERVRAGLPLWHESDCASYDDSGID
jgi:hypothetical protein